MRPGINDFTEETVSDRLAIPTRIRFVLWISVAIVFIISILDFTGWITGSFPIKNPGSHLVNMKGITSVCFMMTSIALSIIIIKRPVSIKFTGPLIIGVLIILVALISIFGWFNLKIAGNESSLAMLPFLNWFFGPVERMPMITAINFIIIGIILILLSLEKPFASNIAHIIFLPVAVSGFLIPVSYLLNSHAVYDFFNTQASLNSGISFFFLCVAVYLMQPDTTIMKVFTSRNTGGIMARRLLPWFALLPVVGSWLQILGMESGLIIPEAGMLLETIIYSLGFVLLIWFNAKSVNLIDKEKEQADIALKKSNEELEDRVRDRTSELLKLNKLLDEEIKERIKAEELVKAERTRINGMLELLPAHIILLKPDYQVIYTNHCFRDRFGDSSGKHCYEFLFNRTEPCENCETFKVLEKKAPHTWEWIGPDERIYSIYDYPYTDTDGSQLIMEMGIDITSLKKAESNLAALNAELEQKVAERTSELKMAVEQLKTSQKIAHLGSWELDLENDILKWSDEVYNIFGVNPEEFKPSYKAFLEIVHPEDIEIVNYTYQNSIKEGMDFYEVDHRIIRKKTGEIRYLYEKSNHIRNNEGRIIRSLGMVHDITERKMMELELQRNNERLEILSQTSGHLLESENPQDLVNSLCIRVMKFLDCQVFFNFLTDEAKGMLLLNSYAGIPQETARKIKWLEFGEVVCGYVAREGVRYVGENIPETNDPRIDHVRSFGIRSYACHPLMAHDRVIGTLSFGTTTRAKFTEDELSMMKTVADQVSVAISRVKDKEVLLKSEERYRSLMELSPGASFVVRNDKVVMLNSAARNLLRISSIDEIPERSIFKIFHYQSHARIKVRLDKIRKGENVPMSSEQIKRADGVIRDVEVVAAGISDSEGLAIQIIMSDITERILAEKELFDTKNYLENLIDYANAPIIVWDKENKIRLFNHAFERLTGYTSYEVNGKKLDLLFPKDSLKDSMRKIKGALTENWETIEIPILTKQKDIRTVIWNSAKIYDESKKTFSTIAQGYDITERIEAERALKESKEKLDMALENGKIGIWEWDINTDTFIIDQRMEKMLGKNHSSFENTYEAFEKSIHEEDLPHIRNAIRQALDNGTPLDTIFRIKHENNEVNYISTKALVDKDNDKKPVKMSGVCFDITEMKMGAEKVLFALNEELLRSNRELEQFAYVASHDLQEPLRTISSFTQLLAVRYKDKLDSDAQEFIQFAVDGAIRMQLLINGLLDYSRVGTRGKKFSPVDMQDLLKHIINNLNVIIQEKNALITNDDLPVVVADGRQMIQLLQNLIGNALKFCKSSPRIHISAIEEKDYYLFSVRDNGIGIENLYFDKIFQIFQRLHPREEYGGTGIGLAICKRIVERHDGKIWVESKPGKGSVFYFTISRR